MDSLTKIRYNTHMNLTKIYNIDLPELKIYKELRDKKIATDNSFIADSPKVVNMLLDSDMEVRSILATEEYYNENTALLTSKNISKCYVASKILMQQIVGHTLHHNVMMHGVRPSPTPLDALGDQIIMLDEISSTQNIGAIARSAAALGIRSYLLPKQGPHPYARRALRVSMGYISKLKYHQYDNISKTIRLLKERGYCIYAAEVTSDATQLAKVKTGQKWVLIMGHEGLGLSQKILDLCDEVLMIEMMEDVKSFNVAIAASIIMYRLKNAT